MKHLNNNVLCVFVLFVLMGLALACGGGGGGTSSTNTAVTDDDRLRANQSDSEMRTINGSVAEDLQAFGAMEAARKVSDINKVKFVDEFENTYYAPVVNGSFTITVPAGRIYTFAFMCDEEFIAALSYADKGWFKVDDYQPGNHLSLGQIRVNVETGLAIPENDPWEGHNMTDTSPWSDSDNDKIPDIFDTDAEKPEPEPVYEELIIGVDELPFGGVGVAYSQTLTATGGLAPYNWSCTVGTLPAGLSLDASTGVISGTPSELCENKFTLRVTDARIISTSQEYVITIHDMVIKTESLPYCGIGNNYSAGITAEGGLPPVTYSVKADTFPAGLIIDSATGNISGTPTKEGFYTVTATVKDSFGITKTKDFPLYIYAYDETVHAWPRFRRDSQNSGVAPVNAIMTATPTVSQICDIGSLPAPAYATPVVGGKPGQEIVFAPAGHKMVAYDMSNPDLPRELWNKTFPGGFEASPVVGPNGTVLVATERWIAGGTPELALLDVQTGAYIWKVLSGENEMNFDAGMMGSPLIDKGLAMYNETGNMRTSIYCTTYYGNNYSIDLLTGTKNWWFRGGNSSVGTLLINKEETALYSSTKYNNATNGVYAISPALGTQQWFYCTTNNNQASTCMSEDGTLYQYNCDAYLYSLSPEGVLNWKTKISNGSYCSGTMSSPAFYNGRIYTRTFGQLTVVNTAGEILKTTAFANPSKSMRWYDTSSAVIATGKAGRVYVADNGGGLHAFDLDGNEVWSVTVSATQGFLGSPAIGWDGTVYIIDYAGNLYRIFDPDNR